MNYYTIETEKPIAGVARSAMMVDLNIAVYSGRKQDKSTQAEVTNAKGSRLQESCIGVQELVC